MISKMIVEEFDGSITFESEEGKGSCFVFMFKLQGVVELDAYKSQENQFLDSTELVYLWAPKQRIGINILESLSEKSIIEPEEEDVLNRCPINLKNIKYKTNVKTEDNFDYVKKILIVDDQFFNIDAALIILQYLIKIDNCLEICEFAQNGQQALDKVISNLEENNHRECTYDLILMDCNMPFMDGYESTERIRQQLYNMRVVQPIIIAVTGHTEPNYVERAINSGMNQVFSKPLKH